MKKSIYLFLGLIFIFLFAAVFLNLSSIADAADFKSLEIKFFHSETCPHCKVENAFLNEIDGKYEGLKINRYLVSDDKNTALLSDLLRKKEATQYLGVVPITFVGDELIVGFDKKDTTGAQIINLIEKQLGISPKSDDKQNQNAEGTLAEKFKGYSLPALSVVLGAMDGFNICSLGALLIILGLALKFKSRKKILLYGGIYIIVASVIYMALIVLWNRIFVFLSPYMTAMDLIIGLLGVFGGIYFFREYLKFRKFGVVCDSADSKIVSGASSKMKSLFESRNIISIIFSVFLFAATITIVEFPCSAVLPVMFSGILAKSGVSTLMSILYILIYMVFYMLDELIIFAVASYKMSMWMNSPKFAKTAVLVESVFLFLFGAYYIINILL